MSDTLFVNGTVIVPSWLNDVNTSVYNILAAVAGTNTITANAPSTVLGYVRGQRFFFTPAATNTGAATLNIGGLGAKAINKQGNVPLVPGDLVATSTVIVYYDGAQFQLLNPQGPLDATDTYIPTAGTTLAYTVPVAGNFSRFVGNAVKLIFNASNTASAATLDVDGTGPAPIKLVDTLGNKIDPGIGALVINTPATAVWDGTNWLVIVEYTPGRLLNTQVFLNSGTYTPTPGATKIRLRHVTSAGAGGGAPATGAGQVSAGGGGGGGGYGEGFYPLTLPSYAVVIGAAGAAVSGATGGNGGPSSFGALMTSVGGLGGGASVAAASIAAAGGFGGGVSGANILSVSGQTGGNLGAGFITNAVFLTGYGGSSPWGFGSVGSVFSPVGSSPGGFGTGRGGGGSGAGNAVSSGALAGGAGTAAQFIVEEYS